MLQSHPNHCCSKPLKSSTWNVANSVFSDRVPRDPTTTTKPGKTAGMSLVTFLTTRFRPSSGPSPGMNDSRT